MYINIFITVSKFNYVHLLGFTGYAQHTYWKRTIYSSEHPVYILSPMKTLEVMAGIIELGYWLS